MISLNGDSMIDNLPTIFVASELKKLPVSKDEIATLQQARELFDLGYCGHALLDIWNASISNLRRRVDAYGVDLWESVVKEDSGRRKYDRNGETLSERWSGVDDLVLISGATKLGLLNKKAGKSLEMINWMRNHASPAHGNDQKVEKEDVVGLALILDRNLFKADMPDPGHSVSSLFSPIKLAPLTPDSAAVLADQIKALKLTDMRTAFGFLLDMLCSGGAPAGENAKILLPTAWKNAPDEIRKTAGTRYHSLRLDQSGDTSADKGAKTRLLDFLIGNDGVGYIPDGARAFLFRRAAKKLAIAKDTSYGWSEEEKAAKNLAQLGTSVPGVAFEEVYQEIASVYCGNYWGRSGAYEILEAFLDALNTTQIRRFARMFIENPRVQSELSQLKPKREAAKLLGELSARLTISSHKDEVDEAISHVKGI